jgi:hypothetical protein
VESSVVALIVYLKRMQSEGNVQRVCVEDITVSAWIEKLYQADGRVAASDDYVLVEPDVCVRFNLCVGRTGRVWGGRYWSRVLEGEPSEGAVEVAAETEELAAGTYLPTGVSPPTAETPMETGFSPQNPARSPPPPS